MRPRCACVVMVVVLVAGGCGQRSEPPRAAVMGSLGDRFTARLARAEVEGPVVATLPAGAVVYGGISGGRGAPRLERTGVVLDAGGDVRTAFATDVPFDRATFAEADGTLYVGGVPCSTVKGVDEASGDLVCRPGGVAVRSIDPDTGQVRPVPLPDGRLGRLRMERTAVEVFGGSFGLVLRAPDPSRPAQEVALWMLRAGRWVPLPPAPGRVCATADHLVAYRTSDPGSEIDSERSVPIATTAWVLDTATDGWSAAIDGPKVEGAAGVGVISAGCTASMAALVPASRGGGDGVAFDPSRRAWSRFPLHPDAGVRSWVSWPSSDLLVSLGEPGDVMETVDPQASTLASQHRPAIIEGARVAAVGPRHIVVVSPGRRPPMQVIGVETGR